MLKGNMAVEKEDSVVSNEDQGLNVENVSQLLLALNLDGKENHKEGKKFEKALDAFFVPCDSVTEQVAMKNHQNIEPNIKKENLGDGEVERVVLPPNPEVKRERKKGCPHSRREISNRKVSNRSIKKEVCFNEEQNDVIEALTRLSVAEEPSEQKKGSATAVISVKQETDETQSPSHVRTRGVTKPVKVISSKQNEKLLHLSGCLSVSSETSNDVIQRPAVPSSSVCPTVGSEIPYAPGWAYTDVGSPESGYGSETYSSSYRDSPSLESEYAILHLETTLQSVEHCNANKSVEELKAALDDIEEICSREFFEEPSHSITDATQGIGNDGIVRPLSCESVQMMPSNGNVSGNNILPRYNIEPLKGQQPAPVINNIIILVCNNDQGKPKKGTKVQRKIMPKPVEKVYNPARKPLESILDQTKLNICLRKIYNDVRTRQLENQNCSVIHIVDANTKQTNLHEAVINNNLEQIFSLVEIHRQYNKRNFSRALGMVDINGKRAQDYIVPENTLEASLIVQGYLNHYCK